MIFKTLTHLANESQSQTKACKAIQVWSLGHRLVLMSSTACWSQLAGRQLSRDQHKAKINVGISRCYSVVLRFVLDIRCHLSCVHPDVTGLDVRGVTLLIQFTFCVPRDSVGIQGDAPYKQLNSSTTQGLCVGHRSAVKQFSHEH